jgi:hypothetical protein
VLQAKEAMVLQGLIDGLIAIGKCYRMEMNVGGAKVMRIKRQASTIHIIIHQNQLEKVEYFKCLGIMMTNDAKYTCEIKSRIAMAKEAFNKKKAFSSANWT